MEFAGKLRRESNFGPRGRCNRHNAFKGKGVQGDGGSEYIWLGAVAGDTPHHDWHRFSGMGTHPTLAYAIDRSCL